MSILACRAFEFAGLAIGVAEGAGAERQGSSLAALADVPGRRRAGGRGTASHAQPALWARS